MKIFLSFVPVILFSILAGYAVEPALWAAAGLMLLIVAMDFIGSRSVKILNGGSLILFVAMALYGLLFQPGWSESVARLVINLGLLMIVLVSIALARPFTLQYAREEVPEIYWTSPGFISANYRISWAWAGAFAAGAIADTARLFAPSIPHWVDSTVSIVAIVAAVKFTFWYPEHLRSESRPNIAG